MATDSLAILKPVKPLTSRPYRKRALTQVIELQERAYQIALKKKIKESVACFAMRSWCSLQEERRKLEMRPLPKPVDVTKLPRLARAKQLPAVDLEELPPSSTNPRPE